MTVKSLTIRETEHRMYNDCSLLYWVWFSSVYALTALEKIRMLKYYKTPERIWHADLKALAAYGYLTPAKVEALADQKTRENASYYLEVLEREQIQVIQYNHKVYPELLKYIADPPVVLYVKGEMPQTNLSIAVVGSRKASGYGSDVAEKLSYDLSAHGFTVVSGMARGIDTSAHRGVLKHGGKTISVLGCGNDIVYPPENGPLKKAIEQSGAVVSEYLPGTPPCQFHFPVRNRIISGMSLGVIVVEAREKSGSLITVNYALEQNRDVYAVPGNITGANSRGTNHLIKEGAKLVLSVDDILEEYLHMMSTSSEKENMPQKMKYHPSYGDIIDESEKTILGIIEVEPVDVDILQQLSGIEAKELHYLLLNLELKGFVKQIPGKKYMLSIQ